MSSPQSAGIPSSSSTSQYPHQPPQQSQRGAPPQQQQQQHPQRQQQQYYQPPLYQQPQWTIESIHEFYRDPHNRELYSKHPQYKHMFDKYDAEWGKSSRRPMTYSSIILIGGLTVAAGALGLKYAIRALKQLKPGQGTPMTDVNEAVERMRGTFYEGGFEKDMSKREASLILGCRETASRERIMSRYRLLMKLNHPDLGGSPHISTKVNEAKELLSRTARSEDELKT